MASESRPPPREPTPGSVLVVDDDEALTSTLAASLSASGYEVAAASTGGEALELILRSAFEVIISDIDMPGMSGVDLLTAVRAFDADVPFIFLTGKPSVETAIDAIAHGALQYLLKPAKMEQVLTALTRARKLREINALQRQARELQSLAPPAEDLSALSESLDRTLETLWVAFQPIIRADKGAVYGQEALMRSRHAALPHPGAILDAAEKLGRLDDVGRRVRALAAEAFAAAPEDALLFVNLHTNDLLDPELYDEATALRRISRRVVLEITERAAVDHVADLRARVETLRSHGFRVAIDDLGAGHANLTSFVALEPDLVKLDMALVRNIDQSSIQQRLVSSLVGMCRDMHIEVVAEGIETQAEQQRVTTLGCPLLQGYLFAKPGAPFPAVRFG